MILQAVHLKPQPPPTLRIVISIANSNKQGEFGLFDLEFCVSFIEIKVAKDGMWSDFFQNVFLFLNIIQWLLYRICNRILYIMGGESPQFYL